MDWRCRNKGTAAWRPLYGEKLAKKQIWPTYEDALRRCGEGFLFAFSRGEAPAECAGRYFWLLSRYMTDRPIMERNLYRDV
ncbi:MAG: hypothetical protein DBY04_08375 [Clostridiales bacterium]|nr:MAG: hypothetical protein DBY04_08375 [Clostridiales bacterium]